MEDLFLGTQQIHIATDGGYDPNSGISTYGWVIATADTIIATGRGPAEAHPSMANSFRVEGYGAALALLLVISYIEVHNIPMEGKTWTLHINNKSMVDRLAEHTTPWKRKSKHQTRSEADITNIADKLPQKISHVKVKHIKSHQDSTSSEDQLSWPARLNIIADRQAIEQREEMEARFTT
jgi:ribonuclease HI